MAIYSSSCLMYCCSLLYIVLKMEKSLNIRVVGPSLPVYLLKKSLAIFQEPIGSWLCKKSTLGDLDLDFYSRFVAQGSWPRVRLVCLTDHFFMARGGTLDWILNVDIFSHGGGGGGESCWTPLGLFLIVTKYCQSFVLFNMWHTFVTRVSLLFNGIMLLLWLFFQARGPASLQMKMCLITKTTPHAVILVLHPLLARSLYTFIFSISPVT